MARIKEYKNDFSEKLIAKINWYYKYYYHNEKIVQTESFFVNLASEVNEHCQKLKNTKREIIQDRYIRDIYYQLNQKKRKIAERVEGLNDYLDWLGENR